MQTVIDQIFIIKDLIYNSYSNYYFELIPDLFQFFQLQIMI